MRKLMKIADMNGVPAIMMKPVIWSGVVTMVMISLPREEMKRY